MRSVRLPRALLTVATIVVAAACGRDPVAPPPNIYGAALGTWGGSATYDSAGRPVLYRLKFLLRVTHTDASRAQTLGGTATATSPDTVISDFVADESTSRYVPSASAGGNLTLRFTADSGRVIDVACHIDPAALYSCPGSATLWGGRVVPMQFSRVDMPD